MAPVRSGKSEKIIFCKKSEGDVMILEGVERKGGEND